MLIRGRNRLSAIGVGKPQFRWRNDLKLTGDKTCDSGVVRLRYQSA
jgi:hypothetical protein